MVLAGFTMLVLVEGLQGGLALGGNMETTPDEPLLHTVRSTVVKQVPPPLLNQLIYRAVATWGEIHDEEGVALALQRGVNVGRLTFDLKATSPALRSRTLTPSIRSVVASRRSWIPPTIK